MKKVLMTVVGIMLVVVVSGGVLIHHTVAKGDRGELDPNSSIDVLGTKLTMAYEYHRIPSTELAQEIIIYSNHLYEEDHE